MTKMQFVNTQGAAERPMGTLYSFFKLEGMIDVRKYASLRSRATNQSWVDQEEITDPTVTTRKLNFDK